MMSAQVSHLALVVSTLVWFFPAIGAVERPSAGSLGNQLQQNLRPGEVIPSTEDGFVHRQSPAVRGGEALPSTYRIHRVVFQGVRWLKPSRLEAVVAPWLNRELSGLDLHQMAARVERTYVQQGFPEARVQIVQPALQLNVLTLRVVMPLPVAGEGRSDQRHELLVFSATARPAELDTSLACSVSVPL